MLTDGHTDGRMDEGRKVITIAHPEQSSGELKRSVKDLSNDTYAMLLCFLFSDFLCKAYAGTHLNCINKSMQFKWVPTTYAFIKK